MYKHEDKQLDPCFAFRLTVFGFYLQEEDEERARKS